MELSSLSNSYVLNKSYTLNKQKGNKGAAYLEYLLTDFVLMHRIDEAKDIGNDFICELVNGESPTRVLFLIQCKTMDKKPSLSDIGENTIGYWKGFETPIYVFWLKKNEKEYKIRYKRFTPSLHHEKRHAKEDYKDYDKNEFIRDIFVDILRCSNKRGMLPGIEIGKYMSESKYMAIVNHKLAKEYQQELESHAWVGAYLLGLLYYNLDDIEMLKKSKECFEFARKFMPQESYIKMERAEHLQDSNSNAINFYATFAINQALMIIDEKLNKL